MPDRAFIAYPHEVHGFLDGRQTRITRPLKVQPEMHKAGDCTMNGHRGPVDYLMREITPLYWLPVKAGDRLVVKETWARTSVAPIVETIDRPWVVYRECDNRTDYGGPWRSPVTMPRWASRLTLTVGDDLVCRRVQDVSEDEARAEGVRGNASGPWGCEGLIEDYADLWTRLHGPDAWDANPWVWTASVTAEPRNIDAEAT